MLFSENSQIREVSRISGAGDSSVSGVTCHVSCVTCHMSHVTCHFFFLLDKVLELIGGGSVINGATPSSLKQCFQFLMVRKGFMPKSGAKSAFFGGSKSVLSKFAKSFLLKILWS